MSKRKKIILSIMCASLFAFIEFSFVGLPFTVFNVIMFLILFTGISYMEINNKFY